MVMIVLSVMHVAVARAIGYNIESVVVDVFVFDVVGIYVVDCVIHV